MKIRRGAGELAFDIVNNIFMAIVIAVTLYPILYVAFSSISVPSRLMRHQGILIAPLGLHFGAYEMVFRNPMMLRGYFNTIMYVTLGTAVNLLMTSLGAYVLSQKSFPGKTIVTFGIVFTMFFSGGLIPFYLAVKDLGIINTPFALVLPVAINTYNLIVMRTSFMAVPDSLHESARIDGANDWVILFKIVLGVSKPVIAVMILFYGVYHWNAWFNAMIFLRKRELYPLQLILREILINNSTDNLMTSGVDMADKEMISETIKYATIMSAVLPILFAYPFLQRYFEKGVMIGAIKE